MRRGLSEQARLGEKVESVETIYRKERSAHTLNCGSEEQAMDESMPKVLIVDDDDGIRHVLRELLAEEGFQVRTACDGQEALEVLQREGGWVILLDMRMPNIDGPAVLREFERDRRMRDTNKVAVMSAGWGQTQQRPRLQPGFVRAVLSKPFELDNVVEVVTQLAS